MTLPPSDLDTQALAALAGALHPTSPRPDGLFSRESPSWQRLLAAARQHRVAGLISVALTRAGRLESLPETVRLQLRRDVLAAQRECAIQRRALAAAAAVLSAAGIPVIALKGAALQLTVYEQPGLRPMSDVDLLVAPDRLDDAVEALERGGFIKPSDADVAFWKSAYYNLPLSAPGEPPAVIEIHWSIAQEDRHRPDVAGLFRRRQVVRLDIPERGEIGVLSPCDLLLHQALLHSYHFF
ncbi:MAG: nucleotidyltransferase family protein [Acidobacteriota bacterium]|nr:MAG: nucleotidyltransferase family protein [Acidobacteriota bacterium]